MKRERLRAQLEAWLAGKLVVGRTVRDGCAHLKKRKFISVHIDELMGRRWRPGKRVMLETSLAAFDIVRERVADAGLRVLLTIPIQKTRFALSTKVSSGLIEGRMLEVQRYNEPPEIFVYARREKAVIRSWLGECVALGGVDDSVEDVTVVAVPRRKSARAKRAVVTTDCLAVVAR